MDIHQPKPIHNWREFLKEYAIIVIGVLTALGAEQAVAALHDRERAAQARTSISAEIAYNLGQMEVRNATEGCVTRRLGAVDGLIAAAAVGKLPQGDLWIGRPFTTFFLSSQYKAASDAGYVVLLDDRERAAYAFLYSILDTYPQALNNEQKAWADLRALEKHPLPSAALDALLRSAVQQARAARWSIEAERQRALTAAAEIGIKPALAPLYNPASVCIALSTPRAEAVKLVAQGRPGHFVRDEP
jgi:hypothetical protein